MKARLRITSWNSEDHRRQISESRTDPPLGLQKYMKLYYGCKLELSEFKQTVNNELGIFPYDVSIVFISEFLKKCCSAFS